MGSPYISYLLRIWQASDASENTWRASLEDPHTRQLVVFRSLEQLICYLEEKITKPGKANETLHSSDAKRYQ